MLVILAVAACNEQVNVAQTETAEPAEARKAQPDGRPSTNDRRRRRWQWPRQPLKRKKGVEYQCDSESMGPAQHPATMP